MKLPFLPKKWGKRQSPTLGLDIGSHTIKIVEYSGTGARRRVRRIGRALVPPNSIVDGSIREPEAVAKVLKALLDNLQPKNRRVSTAIAGYSVIVKKISVPYDNEKEIEDNLLLEAENYVPFEIEDVYVDFHILGPTDGREARTDIFLVAAKREVVDEYAALIQEVGLLPSVVDVDAFALGNSFEQSYDLNNAITLVDIGAQKTNLSIVYKGESLFARDMAFGGALLTETIKDSTGLSEEEAEKVKIAGSDDEGLQREISSITTEMCKLWAGEIKKALDFHNANSKPEEHPSKLFLSGGSSLFKGLDELFRVEIDMPVTRFNPFVGMEADSNIEREYLNMIAPQLAIASGLALRTVEK